jgi:hypothetical protein
MNRTFGIVVTVLWVASMSALVVRDLPFWRMQEPPARIIPNGDHQVGIFSGQRRIGTTWVTSVSTPAASTVEAMTVFSASGLIPYLPTVGEFVCVSTLSYDPDLTLSSFMFRLYGVGIPVQVSADRYGRDFSCAFRLGDMTRNMALDAGVSENLGESVRPFTHLEGLHVGQTWRIRLVDPLTLLRTQSIEFTAQPVTVTRREAIEHGGQQVECFRIETAGTVAWADDRGRVLRQEVQMPLLGRWTIVDEPFNAVARGAAKARLSRLRTADGIDLR